MKKITAILLTFLTATTTQAQNACTIQRAEVYYNTVIPGTKNTVIKIGGEEEPATLSVSTNLTVYLVTNCMQQPMISLITPGKKKMALEFIRIKVNRDEAGTDEAGNPKIIKTKRGSYLWKATQSAESGKVFSEKKRVILTGTIGRKKYTTSVMPVKLQGVAMY